MTDTTLATSLTEKLERSRVAARALATTSSGAKDAGLEAIAQAVESGADRILPANELDLANGRENGLSAGLQDRLKLDESRLAGLAQAVRDVIALPDPVWVDDGRIGQLVSNLLANALAHGDPEQPVELDAAIHGSELKICVANSGPTIPGATATGVNSSE